MQKKFSRAKFFFSLEIFLVMQNIFIHHERFSRANNFFSQAFFSSQSERETKKVLPVRLNTPYFSKKTILQNKVINKKH
jgi:hypothetical protein